ncbi:hypothetical protein CROQUDRAFT_95287 [Cronartium quercuum f. sp. fusiforme G11]|uniref:Importin N-terminal domain-containing protein n=1 Tax=Cronartium quercuum f. sp. fusiforme G11 TaxID=708437 RepID=A0A9P6T9K5_9BASI|nr:hypothetical protein CROQUDRAFT_95287 [Cronartium quercuum f. sp. fusiforme G11]
MDHSHDLESLFQASLSSDLNSRHAAEHQLKALEQTHGFVSALFSLVASSTKDLPVRQAAAVYLKNRIRNSYDRPAHLKTLSVSEPDRAFLKQHLLDGLSSVQPSIRALLLPTLSVIITTDYPHAWPELLAQTVNLISTNNLPLIEAGLLTLVEIIRLYRWAGREKGDLPDQVINATFPILLSLAQTLINQSAEGYSLQPRPSSVAEANSNIGTLMHLILKIYKTSITAELPPFHQQHIVPWGQLLLTVVRKPLKDALGFPSQLEERERWGWTKAKKWAYFTLNRLYSRYGSPSQLPSTMLLYKPFAENFIACFACPILRLYLDQVELYVQGLEWMSRRVVCHTIIFFEESIRPKETWAVLRSHISGLLPRFIFPLVCITPKEVQEFQEEPEDYARAQFGEFFEDLCASPSTMAAGFILALGSGRKKTTFMSMLTFITEICAKYPNEASPREKDGALRMLAYLATVITETKTLRKNIEECFMTYVFPEFQSEHGFLRARTCEVIRKFENADTEWTNPKILSTAYQGVMQCLSDSALPVRVQAALTIPDLSEHPEIHEALAPHIGNVMQGMLRLSNEVDLDSLTQSTRCLVSAFSDELLPYAADLARALQQSYMRLMSEIADTRQRLGDEDDDSSEEKVLVAMNILKTLQQLVVGLEGNPAVLVQVEAASIPLIEYTLKQELVEIYDEALELLDSIQFALKAISNAQWLLFDIIYSIFKTSGTDFISEMFPSLDNFITYGSDYLAANAEQRSKIFDIYLATITSKSLSCSDRTVACKLADSVLLCMKGNADEAIPIFIENTMKIIQRGVTTVEPTTTKGLYMHALEVILNTIYYNANMAMSILVKNNWSADFFGGWFNRLSSFQRTHDKKLSLLAICSILSISLNASEESILVQSSAQLLIGALTLFESLPNAIRNRFELENEYNIDSDDSDDGNTTIDESGEHDGLDDADDDDIVDPQLKVHLCYDDPRRARENEGDDDRTIPPSSLWSDEILWETPLDRVDVYKEFAVVMKNVENSGHPILHIISNALSAEHKLTIQKILHQANSGGEQIIKNEIQQSIQASHKQ